MAKEAITRLGYKLLNPEREYFSIKKEDKEAIEEIINYYNATQQLSLDSNKLLFKFMYYTFMRCCVNNRGKKMKDIMQILQDEIINTDENILLEFLSDEIDLSRWQSICESIGINANNISPEVEEKNQKLIEENKNKFIELVKKPYTSNEAFKLIQGWFSDLLLKHQAKEANAHPMQFTKDEIDKLHKNFSSYGK